MTFVLSRRKRIAGFWNGHSTLDHIFVFHSVIDLYLSSTKRVYCAFIVTLVCDKEKLISDAICPVLKWLQKIPLGKFWRSKCSTWQNWYTCVSKRYRCISWGFYISVCRRYNSSCTNWKRSSTCFWCGIWLWLLKKWFLQVNTAETKVVVFSCGKVWKIPTFKFDDDIV